MTCNVGKTDKVIRSILGIGVIAVGAYFQSWWALAGLVPLGTAVVAWCPAYVPFKINTGA